jgi:hypothetical protein
VVVVVERVGVLVKVLAEVVVVAPYDIFQVLLPPERQLTTLQWG